ncbi:MAG TPA: peptidyl-prolyl cis-trans isomerase, EpsD family [Chlorobaculum sp.]|uniref:Lipoprotein, putative n=1 Tax=Chlorobaculum tepidum (strain ATCC 49652 / DSM 12025 / NBRC 103806 / TLS) TaxID=194439 RepID=Q8KEH8_CHLTE|nr:EpsD family peptidyl-prolyl cis-trans isomerase [Chlorobaculum tepidum]AAM71948.1 lipoprotein, putative [Chlorobaculum tepidum TLS]HBU22867.1 peptidyl-prolyl cis-trans isomerase, EpsD family [Chlorobaculum sp.]
MKKITSLFFVLLFAILVGCSEKSAQESNSGVAAVVNGVEITNRQIDYFYQRTAMPGMSAEDSANLKRRILSDLIRIELLAGKAKEMKLDNNPDYSMALYAAQKNVLAGLAERKLAGNQAPVTPDQAESVVQNAPQLFAGRKLYVFEEVIFPGVDMPLLESLDAMATNGAPLSGLLDELKAKKKPFNSSLKALTSEQLPAPILAVLNKLKPNTPQVVRSGDKVSVILVLHDAIPAPLEGDPARRAAAAMIEANQRNQALSKAMQELLDNAKITYYNEYAKTADGKDKLSALPVPDANKATRELYKKIILGSGLTASFTLTIMMLTAVMRTFYSMLWLPRLWPGSANDAERTATFDIRHTTPLSRQIYLFALLLLIAVVIIFELVLVWSKLAILAMLAYIAGGIIVGVFASYLLNVGISRGWSRKTYMLIASFIAFLILVCVVLTIKMSSLV